MISPLEKDDRLILEPKSPLFPNLAHQNFIPERSVSEVKMGRLPALTEDREPLQKPRLPHKMSRIMSSLYPAPDDNPKRRFDRRNSKTPAMMVSAASGALPASVSQRKYQRRNSAVETTLFPLTKSPLMDGISLQRRNSDQHRAPSLLATRKPGLCIPDDFDEERLLHRLRTSLGLSSIEGKVTHDRSWHDVGDSIEPDSKRRKRSD